MPSGERRIKHLEAALRAIDAEVEEYVDINYEGNGPNLAMRVAVIVQEAL